MVAKSTGLNNSKKNTTLIQEAEADIKKGQKLTVFIQPSESGGMKFKPTILEAEAN